MDLQNPSGAGISGVIYDFNGDVYPTDEARMLARIGNTKFKIGNVSQNSYDEIFNNPLLRDITKKSILQTTPSCSNCIYNLYCGSDPIRNFVESGDIVGYRPNSEFCKKNKLLFDHLFTILEKNDNDIMNVFWSWLSKKNIGEIRV
jgi:radical SAM protein with 4Fe4S-binding SPASM domain